MNVVNYVRTHGSRLISAGYRLVRLQYGGKAPLQVKWATHPITTPQQISTISNPEGVGVVCGQGEYPLCVLDFDVPDERAAATLRAKLTVRFPFLNEAICRIGRAPKFSFILRAEQAGWRKTYTPVFSRTGKSHNEDPTASRLEVLGDGQQCVIYNVHPDTGQPYGYENPAGDLFAFEDPREPLTTPASDLPCIDRRTLREVMDATAEILHACGFKTVGGTAPTGPLDGDKAPKSIERVPLGLTVTQIREIFDAMRWDWESYDKWLEAGMRIHYETRGGEDGLRLWDEFSQKAANYGGYEVCRLKWASFGKSTGEPVTMYPLARHTGLLGEVRAGLNDKGLLIRALQHFADSLRFVGQGRTPWYFDENDGHWHCDSGSGEAMRDLWWKVMDKRLLAEADCELDDEYAQAIRTFREKLGNSYITTSKRLYEALRSSGELYQPIDRFNADTHRFATANGVINLDAVVAGDTENILEVNTADRLMAYYASAEYNPDATCPVWDQAMKDWFADTPEVIPYLYRVLGSALAGDPVDDAVFFMVGEGCNGKSVFSNTLMALFGSYGTAVDSGVIVGTGRRISSTASPDLMRLVGRRFALVAETDPGDKLRAADVKRMSGGEMISARGLYQDQTVFKPSFTLFVGTNYEPTVVGDDNGVWRRIKLIPFYSDFDNDPRFKHKKNPRLDELLRTPQELSGILNRLLEGYRDYKARGGLDEPQSVTKASRQYRDEQDVMAAWFTETLTSEGAADNTLDVYALYDNYVGWLRSNGEGHTDRRLFVRQFRKRIAHSAAGELIRRARGYVLKGYRYIQAEDMFDGDSDDEDGSV